MALENHHGRINRISGPVIGASGIINVRLHEMVLVGEEKLVGEVIRLDNDQSTIQVYEDTSGVRIGEEVENTYKPLVATLGPGLIGQIFDGLQRPLARLAEKEGSFLKRGIRGNPLSEEKTWQFSPIVKEGEVITPGKILGIIPETKSINHRVMVPVGISGRILQINSGSLTLKDPVAIVETADGKKQNVYMVQDWPVRTSRPFSRRLDSFEPLITGKRVIDLFFPLPKGGSAIIPGGFGTGKTVMQQSLARWSAVDLVVYVGCGERGNEIAEVLNELPKLEDRETGINLINRTILIANTSNMPVAAREASIYLGITMAEYYRDMGYDVLMLADSTSRWGEALREVSSRLEEIPGEEGYPAYMASRLAEFYERAGHVSCLGNTETGNDKSNNREGSISLVGAVSPPGGDFSDPITQASMRIVSVFWALDYELSRKRHFPAINWNKSYSLTDLSRWYNEKVADDFSDTEKEAMSILGRENELQQVVQLIGQEALSEMEREVLLVSRILREDLLQQNDTEQTDSFSSIEKSYWMLKAILLFHHKSQEVLKIGASASSLERLEILHNIARMKEIPLKDATREIQKLLEEIESVFNDLKMKLELTIV